MMYRCCRSIKIICSRTNFEPWAPKSTAFWQIATRVRQVKSAVKESKGHLISLNYVFPPSHRLSCFAVIHKRWFSWSTKYTPKRERKRERERGGQTDRQTETDRQRERDKDRETERQRETGRERETEKERERETDRQADRQRERERQRQRQREEAVRYSSWILKLKVNRIRSLHDEKKKKEN